MDNCGNAYQPDAIHRWVCDLAPGHPGQHGGPCTRWERDEPRPHRRDWPSSGPAGLLERVREIAGDNLLPDAEAGGRIRALLFPREPE